MFYITLEYAAYINVCWHDFCFIKSMTRLVLLSHAHTRGTIGFLIPLLQLTCAVTSWKSSFWVARSSFLEMASLSLPKSNIKPSLNLHWYWIPQSFYQALASHCMYVPLNQSCLEGPCVFVKKIVKLFNIHRLGHLLCTSKATPSPIIITIHPF